VSKFVLTAQLQLQAPTNVRQVVNQIQSQLGKGVNANVNLQGGPQAQRQLQQITKDANKATTAASNMGKALGVSIRRFTGLAIATRAVSLFTNTLGAAVREGIAFERELIKISQVTGKSISQLKDLTNTIKDLSTGLGVSSTSLLQTSRVLSQAGFSARETEVALKALAKTTLAPTFDDIGRTAEGAVAIFNQFGKGAGALEGQLGSLNAVAGKFAVEAGDLIGVIRRTGGVFKAAGGDLNQLISLFTSVRSTTRESAESISTGLRTILTRIQRPRTIEYLKQYGVELETLEGKFVGPFEAVRRLSQATAGLEQGDLTFIKIAEEIAGFRQIGKVIPLLREFRVAQEALGVAQGGVNSLTKDAASAQAALAVRIVKVKEEFLALIRSVTETATFQLMASTVLSLAESLVRLGEAIKPVLPLLTAFVGIRALKGLGNFAGGIGKGLSARGFASGGIVPGTGNRDTVPAMLTPGEFVIKKSSVAKMGAANLQAMNNNRYAKGGVVAKPGAIGGFFLTPEQGDPRSFPLDHEIQVSNRKVLERTGHLKKGDRVNTGSIEQFFLSASGPARQRMLGRSGKPNKLVANKESRSVKALISKGMAGDTNQQTAAKNLERDFNDPKIQRRINQERRKAQTRAGAKTVDLSGSITGYFPGMNDLQNSAIANSVRSITKQLLFDGVLSAAKSVGNTLNAGVPQIGLNQANLNAGATNLSNDKQTLTTTEGYLFEGIINAITGAKLAGGTTRFDFPSNSIGSAKDGLKKLFTSSNGEGIDTLIKADAKRSASTGSFNSIVDKLTSDINMGRLEGLSFKKFASGGAATGTDTVPAMLTPGEFVVSKQSAKGIGYSNLKRMNQIGKYAAGGIVTPNRHAYGNAPATGSLAAFQANPAGGALQKLSSEAEKTSNRLQQVGFGLSIALSTLQGFIPAVEKGSSDSVKLANALVSLGLQASVAVSLFETFGGSLKKTGEFLDNKLGAGAGKAVAGLAAVAGSTFAVISVFRALEDQSKELADAIQEGNVAQAGTLAGEQFDISSRDVASAIGGAAGGGIGFALGGPVGAAAGAAVGAAIARAVPASVSEPLVEIFTGQTRDAAIALSQAHAQAAATAKVMAEEQAKMNKALQEGNLIEARKSADKQSVSTSQQLSQLNKAIAEQQKIQESNRGSDLENDILRGAFIDLGGFRGRAIAGAEAEEKKLVAERRKAEETLIKNQTPRLQEEVRVIAARQGGSATAESVEAELLKNLKGGSAGDQILAEALQRQGLGEVGESIKPLTLAVQEAQKQFEALNLSLNPVLASTGAAILGLDNLANNLNQNSPPLANSVNTLEAATTSAAAGISAGDFEKALNESSDALRQFGADEDTIKKARTNAKLFTSAQKEFPSILERVKDDLGGTEGIRASATTGDLRQRFATSIQSQLESQGFDKEEARRVGRSIEQGDLSKEQQERVRAGDVSVFSELLGDASKEAMSPLIEATKQAAEVQKKLIPFIQKRIEAEKNLVAAQQQAIDISMEARQAEAQFGGAPVTAGERRRAVAARSNVLGRSAGLSDVGTDVASFRRRREEIRAGSAASQLKPGQQLTPELAAQQDKLKSAQQDQVKSLRDLIKIQQDEIKTIQEKTRLEKESIDSLLAGDIDKFFEQQAAQGAIAAAATGSTSLIGAFGADATGAAAQELQRLQAAGVQEVFGQQIGGAGGLAETTALAGLQQRGITGQAGLRAAQISAGTTPELEAAKATGRALAEELAAAGDLGADMAGDELQTAAAMLQEAAKRIQDAISQERGTRQRGETTGALMKQGRVVEAQAGVVGEAREKLEAAQEAQAAAHQENAKKSANYSAWIAYSTKVQKEGGQLSERDLSIRSEVMQEYADSSRVAAEADAEVANARNTFRAEEQKLMDEKKKQAGIRASLDDPTSKAGGFSRRILPDASAASSSATLPSVMPTDTSSSSLLLPLAAGRNLAGELGEAEGRRRGEESLVGAGGIGAPSSSLLLQGVLAEGRNLAGQLGEEEGRRRGKESLGGFGGLLGGGNIGAARGRETAEQQFDNIFGGLDEQSSETLNNFSDSIKSLQGMEVAHKLGDVNINLGGLDFLKDMKPEIQNNVIESIQKELENYRPTSTGMSKNNSVLPKST
jgi:TP901 family phage tail tape measure protein